MLASQRLLDFVGDREQPIGSDRPGTLVALQPEQAGGIVEDDGVAIIRRFADRRPNIDGRVALVVGIDAQGDHHVQALADLQVVAYLQLRLNAGLPASRVEHARTRKILTGTERLAVRRARGSEAVRVRERTHDRLAVQLGERAPPLAQDAATHVS